MSTYALDYTNAKWFLVVNDEKIELEHFECIVNEDRSDTTLSIKVSLSELIKCKEHITYSVEGIKEIPLVK